MDNNFLNEILYGEHTLIGGTTGSGKSVLIDNIIYHILNTRTPQNTGLILIDPKKVSLRKYKNSPFTDIYADNNRDIINALKSSIDLMMQIYDDMGARDLEKSDGAHYYVIIDELGDLLTTCKKDCLPLLQRIAQLGRASNIHLICATQSPSRAVLSAQLILNINNRVALRCATQIESKQILNGFTGAETLPKYGKCIFYKDGFLTTYDVNMLDKKAIHDRIIFWNNQNIVFNTPVVQDAPKNENLQLKQFKNLAPYLIGVIIGGCLLFAFYGSLFNLIKWLFTP